MKTETSYELMKNFEFMENFNNVPACQEPGCGEPAIECVLPVTIKDGKLVPEEKEYLCVEHAGLAGYCSCCGQFAAVTDKTFYMCQECLMTED